MREKILIKLANWHASHPWRMLLIALLITVIFAAFASQLSVTMRWSDLLPSDDQRTIQFNKIIDEFVSATSLVVVAQGKSTGSKPLPMPSRRKFWRLAIRITATKSSSSAWITKPKQIF